MKQPQVKKKEHPQRKPQRTNRQYKDRLFRMIFKEKKELLSLYNAVNGTHYDNPEELIVNTLENAIYMGMCNDLSFLIDDRMSLYEHQSTTNPNIPLRNLQYIADLYSALTADENLYGSSIIRIPAPRFAVFYNGIEEQPERQVLKLSNAYTIQEKEVELELKVVVLNINPGYNQELMEACKTLRDYTCFVDKVRTYTKEMATEEAVERAIRESIKDDVLAEFLRRNRAEAKKVSIYEYDEEKHMRQIERESRARGCEEGKRLGCEEGKRQAVDNIMKNLKIDLTTACELIEITTEEYQQGMRE